jgi:hypothetical protein
MAQAEHENHNRNCGYGTGDEDPGYDPSTCHALSIRVYGWTQVLANLPPVVGLPKRNFMHLNNRRASI